MMRTCMCNQPGDYCHCGGKARLDDPTKGLAIDGEEDGMRIVNDGSGWWRRHGFTWPRTITMLVVCTCAVYGTWHQTHSEGTLVRVVNQHQPDGYVTEAMCRNIERDARRHDLQEFYGVPALWRDAYDDDSSWWYPLRNDHGRFCVVDFDTEGGRVSEVPNNKVISVTLDLVR